jgi:hypothetical protein
MTPRGEYSQFNEDGTQVVYNYDDLVYYNKKAYVATRREELGHPIHEDSGWSLVGSGASFFSGDEPLFAKPGDKWFDSTSGVMYTRVQQDDSVLYWIEL